jgi:phage-related protein
MANWTLQYINPINQAIDFSVAPFGITSIEGLEIPDINAQSQQAPYYDGNLFLGSTLQPRLITIESGMILGYDDADYYNARRQLSNVLNPALHKNGDLGKLIYTDGNVSREIAARVDSVDIRQVQRNRHNQAFTITFECPDPYLKSTVEDVETIETVVPLFEFPDSGGGLEFVAAGIEFDEYLVGDPITLINEGDVECPINVIFYGPAEDPKIENQTTGEYILFALTLVAGDTLTIDTGAKTISFFDSTGPATLNGNQYLDLLSTFWQLQVGSNLVRFTTTDSSTSARCQIGYKEQYVSI